MSISVHFLSHSSPSLQLPHSLFYIMSDASNPTDGIPKTISLAADAYSEKNSLTLEATLDAGTLLTFVGEYYEKKKKSDFTNDNALHSWEKSRKASGTLSFHEGAGLESGDTAVFKATKVKHSGVNNEDVTITFTGLRQVNEKPVSATFQGKGDIRANDTGSGNWKEIKIEPGPQQD